MRTSKERARLIHRRTAEIKQERRIKRQRRLDAACMAACLFLVIGIGGIDEKHSGRRDCPPFGDGKSARKSCCTGLYHNGAAGVSSWGLRDGSFVPSASEI